MSILPNSASCGSYPRTFPGGRCVLSHRGFLPRLAVSWSDTPSVLGESRRTTAGSRRPSPGRRCTRGRRPGGTGGQHRSSAPEVPRDPGGAGVGSPGGIQLGEETKMEQVCLLEKKHMNREKQFTHHSHHRRSPWWWPRCSGSRAWRRRWRWGWRTWDAYRCLPRSAPRRTSSRHATNPKGDLVTRCESHDAMLIRKADVDLFLPISWATVNAAWRPSSSMTAQLLSGEQMVPTSAIPRVSQEWWPQRS